MDKAKKTPRELLHEAWESWKRAVTNMRSTITNAVNWLFNTLKAWYKVVDAWDKAIWNSIEKKLKEKWKDTTWKIGKIFRDNILKLFIATSLLTYWGVKTTQYV